MKENTYLPPEAVKKILSEEDLDNKYLSDKEWAILDEYLISVDCKKPNVEKNVNEGE